MSVRGVTLAEVLLAVGLLSLTLLSVIGLFAALLGSTTKAANLSAGHYFARSRLEEIIRTNTYWPVAPEASEGLYSTDDQTRTTYFHRVRATPVRQDPSARHTGGYYLEVEVWWWSAAPGQSRAGQGVQSTRTGRFHYPGGVPVP